MYKLLNRKLGLLFLFGSVYISLHAQDTVSVNNPMPSEELIPKTEIYPNPSSKGLMTPTGWGSSGTFIFGFLGGSFPQAYTTKSDMVAAIGAGFGNAYKTISVVGIFNILDVSKASNYSGSLIVSRHLGRGTAMSIGGLHLFASDRSDADASFYIAVSHASQTLESKTPGYSAFSYTVGVGSGRFYDKSFLDKQSGKGAHGTALFGNVSYELAKGVNIIAEWSGLNFGMALGLRPSLKFPAFNIGVADLTGSSGDRPRLILSLGQAFMLSKK